MNLNLRRIAALMLLTACFAVSGTMEVNGQTVIGGDDFDGGGGGFLTRVFSTDNSATDGAYPNSFFDVFGIINRATVNNSFNDDSLSIFTADVFGVIPEEKTDNLFGIQDIIRAETEVGTGDDAVPIPEEERRLVPETITYTFDVTDQSDLAFSFDAAAFGNFEGPGNSSGDPTIADFVTIDASFDGGTSVQIGNGTGADETPFTYTLEGGATVDLTDPFVFGDTTITNNFETVTFPISGTGSTLTIVITARFDGGSEVFAFDNVSLTSGEIIVVDDAGDLNGDGVVDCDDIDEFVGNLGSAPTGALAGFDLDTDGDIDDDDVLFLVTNLVVTSNGVTGTFLGDLNCDGLVDVLGDAFVLVGSLNNSVNSYALGDIDLNGSVDVLGDAFVLIGNLGMSNE